jgi:hypothetical protein
VALLEGTNGQLYGIARSASSIDNNAIFRINPDGSAFTVIRTLSAANEGTLEPTLIQAPDGRLYGTTQSGGVNIPNGGVFVLNPDGSGLARLRQLEL